MALGEGTRNISPPKYVFTETYKRPALLAQARKIGDYGVWECGRGHFPNGECHGGRWGGCDNGGSGRGPCERAMICY